MGPKKKDPLNGGGGLLSGFWHTAFYRIEKRIIKQGFATRAAWKSFCDQENSQVPAHLMSVACNPAHFLSDDCNRGADAERKFVCDQFIKFPEVAPLFFAMIRAEVQRASHLEKWIHARWGRTEATDDDLAKEYTEATGRRCTREQMTQARENFYRRVSGIQKQKKRDSLA